LGPPQLSCPIFRLFPLNPYLLSFAIEHIRRYQIVYGLMVSLVIVIFDKFGDRFLKFPREIVVFEIDHILDCPVVSLDLSLGLWVIGSTTDMGNVSCLQICLQILRDITGPVV